MWRRRCVQVPCSAATATLLVPPFSTTSGTMRVQATSSRRASALAPGAKQASTLAKGG